MILEITFRRGFYETGGINESGQIASHSGLSPRLEQVRFGISHLYFLFFLFSFSFFCKLQDFISLKLYHN